MIDQLFTYEHECTITPNVKQYYGCTLKVPIDDFEVDTTLSVITVNLVTNSLLICGGDDGALITEHLIPSVVA